MGWALYPDDAETVDELVAVADFCVRGVKLTGKDRALSAEDWAPGGGGVAWPGVHRLPRPPRLLSDDPALDAAVSRARSMCRVAAGELPETLRLARPGPVVAFAKRDAVAPGYAEAVAAARAAGFGRSLRLAGGRAAVFHEGTMELAHAVPDAGAAPRHPRPLRGDGRPDRRALGKPRRRRPRGRGAGRVLPRPLERERRRRAQAGGHRPARDRRRGARRHRDGGRGRGSHPTRCWSRSTRRSGSTGTRRRAARCARGAERLAGTRSATPVVDRVRRAYDLRRDSLDAETLELAQGLAAEHRVRWLRNRGPLGGRRHPLCCRSRRPGL